MSNYKIMITNTRINFTMRVDTVNAGFTFAIKDINEMYKICAKLNHDRSDSGKFTYWVEEDEDIIL